MKEETMPTFIGKLSPLQMQHLDSIRWAFSPGKRQQGRSFLLAYVYIEKAIKTIHWVDVVDHEQMYNQREFIYQLENVMRHFPDYEMKIKRTSILQIKVQKIQKREDYNE